MTLLRRHPARLFFDPLGSVRPGPKETEFWEMYDQSAFGRCGRAFAAQYEPDHSDCIATNLKPEAGQRNFEGTWNFLDYRLGQEVVAHVVLPSLMRRREYSHICGEKTLELRSPPKNRPPCRDHDDRPAATANQRREANGNDYNLALNNLELNRPTLPVTIYASRPGFPDREICGCREAPVTTSSCLRSLSQGIVNERHGTLAGKQAASAFQVGGRCRLPSNFLSVRTSRRAGTAAGRASRRCSQPSPLRMAHLLPRPTVATVRFPQQVLACGQVGAGGRHYFVGEASKAPPTPFSQIKNLAHLSVVPRCGDRNIDRSAWRKRPQTEDR